MYSIKRLTEIEDYNDPAHDAMLKSVYDRIIAEMAKKIDDEIVSSMVSSLKPKTNEEKVISILKGGFEAEYGMSFDKFVEIYNEMKETCPWRFK